MALRSGKPSHAERCTAMKPQGRCWGWRLPGSDKCGDHERSMKPVTPIAARVIEPEIDRDGDVRLLQDPAYAERVRYWLSDPKKLLDWRHTMARAQALADMLEDRVRRMGPLGDVPPPLLHAIDELRKMHLAVAKLEAVADETRFIHVSIVDALVSNMVSVLTEYVPAERVPAALDKLQALQEAVVPGTRAGVPPPREAETVRPMRETNGAARETILDPEDSMD